MNARFALLLPLVLVAACERKAENTQAAGAATGANVKIETPAFKADLDLPFMDALGDKMDVDGVKLFPGSKVAGVNVNAMREDAGRVSMRFEAPADRAKVADWFGKQFAANATQVRPTPGGYAGETKDGAWFTLDLKEGGNGRTEGEFRIGEKQQR
jgi:hypothetical protein